MTDAKVTIFKDLSEIYAVGGPEQTAIQAGRWDQLTKEFTKRFDRPPTHICRAPGRVNLIGEHIDYALFGVFPAAVDRDILIACAPRAGTSEVRAQNLDGAKYTAQEFTPARVSESVHATLAGDDWYLEIDQSQLNWASYVKAGYLGVLNHFFRNQGTEPVGVDLLVTGAVPAGSGLSSSAAMVVASTLTFLAVNSKLDEVNKGDLVKLTVENEKRVGVNSGGMDQSASILSLPSHALYISFFPVLHPTQIPLPQTNPPTSLVIANSLKVADKAVSAKWHYNLRVVETLVGARVLAKGLGVPVGNTEKITFREVLGKWTDGKVDDVDHLEEALIRIGGEVERILGTGNGKNGLTFDEMVAASGLSQEEFKQVYLSWVEVEATHFQLYKRARHVFTEARRVLEFRRIALTSQSAAPSETQSGVPVHVQLGKLLDESHESCRDYFDCSCDELNELTNLAKKAGAWGSRLTGAGWGGCTVSLVTESEVPRFIEEIRNAYGPFKSLDQASLEQVIFATKPGSGAGVFVVEA